MSCSNKFHSYLSLERIDFEPATLIVGTFDPEWPDKDKREWFYGNTEINRLWDILPKLYGEPSLINATAAEWKQFCRSKHVAITDLISSIDDADPGNKDHISILTAHADKAIAYNFEDFEFVSIVGLLKRYPSVKNVYLTRAVTEAFWRHIWNPVMHYCNHNNLHERQLVTPSVLARDQHIAHNNQHPDAQIPLLDDYILMRWRQEWHL